MEVPRVPDFAARPIEGTAPIIPSPMPLVASDHSGKSSEISWDDIAPCEHFVQIYGRDSVFLDALEGFTAGGLKAGEWVGALT